jgi:hypothetical protein
MRNTLLLLLLLACPFAPIYAQQGAINKGETWYRIYPDKSLELKTDERNNFSALMTDGKDLVFEYYMRADDRADVTDDEYTEKIVFAVPKQAKTFVYKDSTLKAAFLKGCFCVDRGWHRVNNGVIRGKKLTATTWQVQLDVMTQGEPERNIKPVTKTFKAVYKIYSPGTRKKTK